MFQILHFSDLHLEIPFRSNHLSPSFGIWRRQDLRATLGRLITIAREKKVDAITIAGDLFENEFTMPELAGFLTTQFGKANPIQVVIAPGEKDPYTIDSIYSLNNWPENVIIFKQNHLTKVDLTDNISLWGAACPPTKGLDLFKKLSLEDNKINLLLLHAHFSDLKFSNHNNIYSLNTKLLLDAGFDFVLLGSLHQTRIISDESTISAFPGSPEPFDFENENGGHHAVLLKVQAGNCMYELIPVNKWKYINLSLDVTSFKSEMQVIRSIEKLIKNTMIKDDEQRVIQLTLFGEPDIELNFEEIIAKISTEDKIEINVDIHEQYDYEELAQEPTLLGTLVKHYLEHNKTITDDLERKKELNALRLALQALNSKRISLQ